MTDEYIFNTKIEYSDEVFSPVMEVNSYEFSPNMGDPVVSTAITDHEELEGRGKPDQHPISSITDLEYTLQGLATKMDLDKKASIRLGTKNYWENHPLEVPEHGELIVYTDFEQTTDGQGNVYYIPAMKIGDGSVIVADLPFLGDDIRILLDSHIFDTNVHLRNGEREFWNNKVTTLLDTSDDEHLIFTTKNIGIIYNS